mmetsp:Transcript_5816/g.14277  ORF Transcript_5816/g.14277 Transcript_5816/m.14277 type:complete len:207 (-) Transcript_5816:169-789(-)
MAGDPRQTPRIEFQLVVAGDPQQRIAGHGPVGAAVVGGFFVVAFLRTKRRHQSEGRCVDQRCQREGTRQGCHNVAQNNRKWSTVAAAATASQNNTHNVDAFVDAVIAAAEGQIDRKGRPQGQKGNHRVKGPIELPPGGFDVREQFVRSRGVPGPGIGEPDPPGSDNAQDVACEKTSKDIGDQSLPNRGHSDVGGGKRTDPEEQGSQ